MEKEEKEEEVHSYEENWIWSHIELYIVPSL